ncbi:hypothetical protein IMZ31_22295 (plasmid) [Pontibacillus sp. ALD_SL1]|uniref:hypothetical protein n=1 Tax=Pontibacillus sp. ALD_SL1 TaxID=2777185 RepID=UPI001A95BA26|nr:hypothetical protein [Pontibacillus sp. ALD_SL1]QST02186.1 hypothetical protein IMZ31_22295 [Pontibacillus sp. ALD_SL1]
MNKEIERKFLVKRVPNGVMKETIIHQTYLAIGDEEIRIRKKISDEAETHTLTIKKGAGLVREELETKITNETYEQLRVSSSSFPLIKKRKVLNFHSNGNSYTAEIDLYQKFDFVTVEIEFPDEEAANAFKKPNWIGDEITGYPRFQNQNLWRECQ